MNSPEGKPLVAVLDDASGSSGNARTRARATAQRERILAAAQKCFIEHGFHAASMASIAQTAQMSPGLMYRYFPSKNAIVLAIIERQLEQSRRKIGELQASTDIAANVRQSFKQWQSVESQEMNVALFLGMSADSSHDAQIAQALRASDRLLRAALEDWLARGREAGGLGVRRDVAGPRAFLMQCVIEGLAMRALREPDLDIDTLAPELERLFDHLLAP
jgi:AcrR family transcriptional regulator